MNAYICDNCKEPGVPELTYCAPKGWYTLNSPVTPGRLLHFCRQACLSLHLISEGATEGSKEASRG